jgi:hypothetical protein
MKRILVGSVPLMVALAIGSAPAMASQAAPSCVIDGVAKYEEAPPLFTGNGNFDIRGTTTCTMGGELRTGTLWGYGMYRNHTCGAVQVWEGFILFWDDQWHSFTVRLIAGTGELMVLGKLAGVVKLVRPQIDPTVPPRCASGWTFTAAATIPEF